MRCPMKSLRFAAIAACALVALAQGAWAACPSSTLTIPFQPAAETAGTGNLTDSAGNAWSYSAPAVPAGTSFGVPVTLTPATCGTPPGGPTLVNKASCTSASGPICRTPPVDMTGAKLIVVATSYGTGAVFTGPTDSSSNAYALGVTTSGTASAFLTCDYVFAPTVTNAMTFSGNFSSGGALSYGAISAAGFSAAGSSLDQKNSANSGATGTATSQLPGSITPTQPNELV